MNWKIPAKTFLLGEYAAIAGRSAIVLTTKPCFTLSLVDQPGLHGIHPASPAGLWWNKLNRKVGLSWSDPYAGRGGLGASSAQFLGSYWASCYLANKLPERAEMLEAYYECSWNGTGLKPSGYDVIAQSQQGCVYINQQNSITECCVWRFPHLSFILLHTGVKLATHLHLQDAALPHSVDELSGISDEAHDALINQDDTALINCINKYHEALSECNKVAEHSQKLITTLKKIPEVLAVKGCGALGADVLLVLCSSSRKSFVMKQLDRMQFTILASEADLFSF